MVSTRLERFDAVNATLNSTSTAMRRAAEEKQSVPGEVVAAVGLVSVAVAIVTNSAVLVRACRQFASCVHQPVRDGSLHLSVGNGHARHDARAALSLQLNGAVCMLFEATAVTDCVKVLRPTRHKIAHFGTFFAADLLVRYRY